MTVPLDEPHGWSRGLWHIADDRFAVGFHRKACVKQHLACVRITYPGMARRRGARVVDGNDRVLSSLRFAANHAYVGLHATDVLISQFSAAIVIDNRIGDDWPAIAQVPPQNAGAPPLALPEPF